MMNKKQKQLLNATLDKALAPPKKRGHLDNLLEEYDDGSRLVSSVSKAPEKISPPAIISAPERIAPAAMISPAENFSSQPLQPSAAEVIASSELSTAPEIISHPEQHLRIPNEVLDRIFPTLMPSDQVVLLRLYRLTRGFHNETIKVSMGRLATACHLSSRQVTTCVQRLQKRSLIEKVSVDWSSKNQAERGVVIKILLPAVPRENISASAKISRAEKTSATEESAAIKYINTHERNTQTQGASASSRFTLEECRRYAESLKGKGIHTPGAYATTIYRSGEADEMIEAFLRPKQEKPLTCALCAATGGYIYVDETNRDKGVRPCKHQ